MERKKNQETPHEMSENSKRVIKILEEALELSEGAEDIPHKYPEVYLELSNTHIHRLKIDFDDLYPLEYIDFGCH